LYEGKEFWTLEEDVIGSAESESFWVQGAIRRYVRDESGERGRETVVAESNPANGDYDFVGELWEVKKPWVRGKGGLNVFVC